jgi:hypothetical protein
VPISPCRRKAYPYPSTITYLSIILLCLELQLNVEEGNLGILIGLALHLEAGIAEGLLEGDAGYENGVLQGAALHLLDPDHVEGQEVVQHHDGVHDHLAEELLLLVDELAGHGGGGALLQQGTVFLERKKNNEIKIALTRVKLLTFSPHVVDPHHFGNLEPHPDSDLYQSDKLDPEPDTDSHQLADDKPNVWNLSLFLHFFKGLSLYCKLGAGAGAGSGPGSASG